MVLLHIAIVAGGGSWRTGVTLWLLTSAAALLFAQLSGEYDVPDALLADLLLAAAGGAALNYAATPLGTDLLAFLYGVRVLVTTGGALLVLVVVHDLAGLYNRSARVINRERRPAPITGTGGLLYLYTWVDGWPFERASVEACYDGSLGLKLTDNALHYQVRRGMLTGAETIPLLPGTRARAEEGTLVITGASRDSGRPDASETLRLAGVCPLEAMQAILRGVAERVALLELSDESHTGAEPHSPDAGL